MFKRSQAVICAALLALTFAVAIPRDAEAGASATLIAMAKPLAEEFGVPGSVFRIFTASHSLLTHYYDGTGCMEDVACTSFNVLFRLKRRRQLFLSSCGPQPPALTCHRLR